MKTPQEIRQIALCKYKDARILRNMGRYDNAYYLAGYIMELYLKARIVERLKIDDLFSDSFSSNYTLTLTNTNRRNPVTMPNDETKIILQALQNKVKIHDSKDLMKYSGLWTSFSNLVDPKHHKFDQQLFDDWKFVKSWNESKRYGIGKVIEIDVDNLFDSIKRLISWINSQP